MTSATQRSESDAGNPRVRFECAGEMAKKACCAVLALAALTAVSDDVTLTSFTTIPQFFSVEKVVWQTADGEKTAWGPYNGGTAVAHIKHVGGSASMSENSDQLNFFGMIVELSDRTTWALIKQNANKIAISSRGVDVKSGRYFLTCNESATIELAVDQTWTGSHTTGNTYFNVGNIDNPNTPLVAADDVTALTIGGRLQAALYGHDNQLSAVAVTVKDSAMLRLPDTSDARLGAAKLVLQDSGVRMAFGDTAEVSGWYYPVGGAWNPVDITAIDHSHLAPVVELRDGAGFSANNGVYGLTNLCVSGTGMSAISGSLTFTQAVTRVTFMDAGAALSMETTNCVAGVAGCTLEVVGDGTLSLSDPAAFSAIDVASGATVALGGRMAQTSLAGAGTVSVSAGASVYLRPSDMTDFTGILTVDGGTLVLDAPLPEGRVTVNAGSVLYGSTDRLVVTDYVRTDATLTVGPGEVLRVFGNGLTAATALKLKAGMLRFENSATVGAAIEIVKDTSYIETAALAVTGSITGALTSNIPVSGRETASVTGTATRGPGCIRFSGGGTWNMYRPNSFLTLDGSVWFCGGTYTFRNTSCGLHYTVKNTGTWGRRWLVTDGAKIQISGYNAAYSTDLRVSGLECAYNQESYVSVLEVRDGGEIDVNENSAIQLSYLQATGRLVVGDGGVVRVKATTGHIRLGHSVTTIGVVELREGGLIETCMPFMHGTYAGKQTYQTCGRFLWKGGTVKLGSNFPETEGALFRNLSMVNADWTDVNGSLRTWVKILGDTCTLDLTDLPARETPLRNVPAGLERSEWFGTGTLTVKGGKPFVMQSMPNDVTLRIKGAGTQVILPENVEIHDYATRCATEDTGAGSLQYTTLDTCLANLSLKEFVSAGRGVVLSNAAASCEISIGTVSVPAGGAFVNAGTLVSLAAVAVTNLVFAENAILGDAGGANVFDVQGDITLPSTTLGYEAFGNPGDLAYRAGGSVVGSPATWTKAGGRRRDVKVDGEAGTIRLLGYGMAFVIR